MTVLSKIRRSGASRLDVHPAGPALDLTTTEMAFLRAEVQRLRSELHLAQVMNDDLLDWSAQFINSPRAERLVAPRERRRVPAALEATVAAGALGVTA